MTSLLFIQKTFRNMQQNTWHCYRLRVVMQIARISQPVTFFAFLRVWVLNILYYICVPEKIRNIKKNRATKNKCNAIGVTLRCWAIAWTNTIRICIFFFSFVVCRDTFGGIIIHLSDYRNISAGLTVRYWCWRCRNC